MFDIGAVTLWLQQNPEWIIFGLCSAAFIESFAIIYSAASRTGSRRDPSVLQYQLTNWLTPVS